MGVGVGVEVTMGEAETAANAGSALDEAQEERHKQYKIAAAPHTILKYFLFIQTELFQQSVNILFFCKSVREGCSPSGGSTEL